METGKVDVLLGGATKAKEKSWMYSHRSMMS